MMSNVSRTMGRIRREKKRIWIELNRIPVWFSKFILYTRTESLYYMKMKSIQEIYMDLSSQWNGKKKGKRRRRKKKMKCEMWWRFLKGLFLDFLLFSISVLIPYSVESYIGPGIRDLYGMTSVRGDDKWWNAFISYLFLVLGWDSYLRVRLTPGHPLNGWQF